MIRKRKSSDALPCGGGGGGCLYRRYAYCRQHFRCVEAPSSDVSATPSDLYSRLVPQCRPSAGGFYRMPPVCDDLHYCYCDHHHYDSLKSYASSLCGLPVSYDTQDHPNPPRNHPLLLVFAFLDVISKVGNFDQAVYDIWNNGGKNFKLAKKDLHLVALPLSQLIVTAHQAYPTQEEFENLCEWLVAQKSDQLASYVLDILMNVYAGVLSNEKARGGIFIMAKKIKMLAKTDPMKADLYRAAYKPLTDKWGWSLEDMPDWSKGHQMLVKAYGEAFSKAIVDGAEALG